MDESQKRATKQNRIMSNAIKHVEALDSKGQPSNPASGQNQIAELIQKQDQKRNVAFLDLTSDLVQLNKQILQKRMLDLPAQSAYSHATKQPQTCQNSNKETIMFSPCIQDGGAPSRSDQLQRGAASDSHNMALCDYPLQQCPSIAPERDGRNQAKAKHSKPVKINLKMVTFKKPKSAERSQA